MPVESGSLHQQLRRGNEVLPDLGLVQLAEQFARLVFVTGISAEREQRIRRERHEVVEREPTGDVFDVRIEAAVLVDDQHRRQLAGGIRGTREIAARLAGPLRRIELEVFGLQPLVVLRHDLRLGEPGVQGIEQHGGGHAADRELRGAIEKAAAVDVAVHVGVEQDQQVLVEVFCGLAFHLRSSKARKIQQNTRMQTMQDPHAGQPVLRKGPAPAQARLAVILVHGRGDSAAGILGLADQFDAR